MYNSFLFFYECVLFYQFNETSQRHNAQSILGVVAGAIKQWPPRIHSGYDTFIRNTNSK